MTFAERMDDFRYEHKILYRFLVGGGVFIVAMLLFMALPRNALMQALGVTALQERASALQNAVYWQARASLNKADFSKPYVTYGTMVGVAKNGALAIQVPVGKKFEQRFVYFADIQLTDLLGTAVQVGSLRTEEARFELYGSAAVVWIRGTPLNLNLVEKGLARPDPNPPTSIVDEVFAAYYWKLFREGRPSQ